MTKKITVIPGDGIGKEITEAAVAVLKKADAKFGLSLEYDYHDAGGTAYDKFGTPLPEETLAAAKASTAYCSARWAAINGTAWSRRFVRKRRSSDFGRASAFMRTCAR